jgi:hypothetical protein
MYPAQALADGLYSANDLPDSVDIINVDIVNELELNRSGAQYFGTTGGNTYKISIGNDPETPDDKYWALDVSFNGGPYGRVTEFACLINYPYPRPDPEVSGFRDQFADTYTVSGGELGPIQVTRVSLCLWEGTDSCGNKAQLIYLEDPFNGKLWFVDVPQYGEPCVIFDVRQGEKIGLQNTPVGGYGNPPYENPFLFVS